MIDVAAPAALAAIHAAFARPVRYRTADGVLIKDLTAIPSNVPAGEFPGAGSTARRQSFELQYVDVPEKPKKGEQIVELVDGVEGKVWRINNIDPRDDVAAWSVDVEKVAS